MSTVTTWRTDDPCPACGTGLQNTDDQKTTRQDCPLCGWSATWAAEVIGGQQ